jgi:ATP-dependent helicase YprA (DUF1998 family)/very-short-patch-repair endonuclease
MSEDMDVFALRERLVDDYASYANSFIYIRDARVRDQVDSDLRSGLLWPEPLIQLNPTFEPGGYVDDLVQEGLLHAECGEIFRVKVDRLDHGRALRLHKHQVDALRAAKTGKSYVLTTGTGSGKSLAYIVPIVDHVLWRGAGKGIQAIVVYPMNALANSQSRELDKFLGYGYPEGQMPVRFARYTGQESEEQRQDIVTNPPDILLTNYVMLELILTRPRDHAIVAAAAGLKFLVFDELHTYRGRQGADVAMLARRVREACKANDLQLVGTSATLAGSGRTFDEQREEVARVATQLFGREVEPDHVIGETLRRATESRDLEDPLFQSELRARMGETIQASSMAYEDFVRDPLSVWIESTFGMREDASDGRLVRQMPRALTGPDGAAHMLAQLSDLSEDEAGSKIKDQLMAGYHIESPETGFRPFAFRLHQFISRGEAVYASLEPEDERFITTNAQTYVPGDRSRVLLPLAFCRECGQDYYVTRLTSADELPPRRFGELEGDEPGQAGYLYISTTSPWPSESPDVIDRLPEDWLEQKNGATVLKKSFREYLPKHLLLSPAGVVSGSGVSAWFVPAPFRFCLSCGVAYRGQSRSDLGKLAMLGSGGRSTATTILSMSLIRALRKDESLPREARKLLSFTDNRQDASLQAGHFNDFVEVSLLRSALHQATLKAGRDGIGYDELAKEVFDALDLPISLYAADSEVKYAALEETQRAMRSVLGYRIYRDLERGWRVTSPNLEQVGLLRIDYQSLGQLCAEQAEWASKHPALASASPETRERVARVLLDHMRRELCIKVNYLQAEFHEKMKQQSSVRLRWPWAVDENEELRTGRSLVPRSVRPKDYGGNVFMSARSGFGQYLRRDATLPEHPHRVSMDEAERIILELLEVLRVAGLTEVVREPQGQDDVPAYQIPASAFRWLAGDGKHGYHDAIRVPRAPQEGPRPNPFFVEFYRTIAQDAKGLEAREHTAQVPNEERQKREDAFRTATLPILFCSPTMELGVDIAELNAVNMRNVPPTPANYAQRSGRAGRSGQPALVFTFCTTGSPHDQYFFRRPNIMVSGQVAPPRLDLGNEDLVKSHIHAVWLAEADQNLGRTLKDVLDLAGDRPSLTLLPSVRDHIESESATHRARERAGRILTTIDSELKNTDWYTDDWLETALRAAPLAFDQSCDRWRGLYKAAVAQSTAQTKVIQDASRPPKDKDQAKRLRREAESQLDLLTAEDAQLMQSDFYSYRYFASEGFLPGYSFPRLPLSCYIPGRQVRGGRDEFLSRPRFLAISEFGPRSFVYHEGSRYIINKVILPVSEDAEEPVSTQRAKQCGACGYLHPVKDPPGPDLCEHCSAPLDGAIDDLFRLQNVSAKRRDRITSDEEERMRQGFEIRTGIRFVEHGGQPSSRVAEVRAADGRPLFRLTYGASATIWRINLGWRRSVRQGRQGFQLDVERGYWAKSDTPGDDAEDPMSPRTRRVVPYVEDHKNCLLLEPLEPLNLAKMASLESALKNAIEIKFQLEDNELASEPLPNDDDRRVILLYEAAEGGAGVLRQLLDDPSALADVAKAALDVCHFDPDSGNDRDHAPTARERCEAACYDCLMSYSNQLDHRILDRHAILPVLRDVAGGTVAASSTDMSRPDQLKRLLALCGSELERKWLRTLDEGRLRLPTGAQKLIESCHTQPDFLYAEHQAVVFVDGPWHNYEEERQADAAKTSCLEDLGYQVIRFGSEGTWQETFTKHLDVFGDGRP